MGISKGACGGGKMKKKEEGKWWLEKTGDQYMERGMYRYAEEGYRKALKSLGRKTWANRKERKRIWNKLMTAMHLESERVGK